MAFMAPWALMAFVALFLGSGGEGAGLGVLEAAAVGGDAVEELLGVVGQEVVGPGVNEEGLEDDGGSEIGGEEIVSAEFEVVVGGFEAEPEEVFVAGVKFGVGGEVAVGDPCADHLVDAGSAGGFFVAPGGELVEVLWVEPGFVARVLVGELGEHFGEALLGGVPGGGVHGGRLVLGGGRVEGEAL